MSDLIPYLIDASESEPQISTPDGVDDVRRGLLAGIVGMVATGFALDSSEALAKGKKHGHHKPKAKVTSLHDPKCDAKKVTQDRVAHDLEKKIHVRKIGHDSYLMICGMKGKLVTLKLDYHRDSGPTLVFESPEPFKLGDHESRLINRFHTIRIEAGGSLVQIRPTTDNQEFLLRTEVAKVRRGSPQSDSGSGLWPR